VMLNNLFNRIILSDKILKSKRQMINFENMFNFRSHILKKNILIQREKSSGLFYATQDGEIRKFENAVQNFYSFKNGFRERNEQLASAYLLREIVWSNNNIIIDCGANIGDFHFALKSIGIKHNYIAFEPSPKEFMCLKQNVPEGNCHNLGLWEHDDFLEFYISMDNADSSFIKPTTHTEIAKIKTIRLDSIDFGREQITLLKLEAEGAELEVLKGSTGILNQISYITADLGFERAGESSLPEVTNFLADYGFEMIKFGSPRIVGLFRNKNIRSKRQ
jgi:FkbM family methyltransferase